MDDGNPGSPVAAIGIVVGGALAVVSAFLQWAGVRAGLPASFGAGQAGPGGRLGRGILGRLLPNAGLERSITGVRTPDGRLVLGVGIALLVLAAVAFLARWASQRAAVGAAAAALGAIALVVPVATTAT